MDKPEMNDDSGKRQGKGRWGVGAYAKRGEGVNAKKSQRRKKV